MDFTTLQDPNSMHYEQHASVEMKHHDHHAFLVDAFKKWIYVVLILIVPIMLLFEQFHKNVVAFIC